MIKKLAKIKYLPNNFQILENGDYVECAVSGKKINIEDLTYWNVDLQEALLFLHRSIQKKRRGIKKRIIYFHRLCDHIHCSGLFNIILSITLFNSLVIFSIDVSFENDRWFTNLHFKISIFDSFNTRREQF